MIFSNDNFFTCMRISDKFLHLVSSTFGMYIGYLFVTKNLVHLGLLVFIVAFLWEIVEIFFADGISWRDLVADSIGILVGVLTLSGIKYLFIIGVAILLICYLIFNHKCLLKK